jgi:hypothetical protein
LAYDFRQLHIGYLMINGIVYKIMDVQDYMTDKIIFKLEESKHASIAFIPSDTVTNALTTGATSSILLQVIGFKEI